MQEQKIIRVHDMEVNLVKRTVTLGGEEVRLTAKEFDLLQMFITNRGRPFSRKEMLEAVWKYDDYTGDARTVDVHIRRLYRYLALSDPDTGEARMEYEAFASKWTEYPALTAFDFSGGSASGTRAVFTVSGTRLVDGVSQKFTGRSVHLMKTGGLWCISMSQLTAIVEGTP